MSESFELLRKIAEQPAAERADKIEIKSRIKYIPRERPAPRPQAVLHRVIFEAPPPRKLGIVDKVFSLFVGFTLAYLIVSAFI